MKIAIVGIGYVGLSNAILLAQHNEVYALDVDQEKVRQVNEKISPIVDAEIEEYLKNCNLKLKATSDAYLAISGAQYVIICTPTNYDPAKNFFDTTTVEDIIEKTLSINSRATMIIKSTVPVGYTEKVKHKYNSKSIIFSPEFLREGKALYDNLYPSRIVVGDDSEQARSYANLQLAGALKKEVEVLYTNPTEAEAIKLFSNTFLALRIAYFNELDSYAEIRGLSSKQIIEGVGLDPRIGNHYNNPSFGYGGYCLPKDTKQLLANYHDVPQNIMSAIVDANKTRKDHIYKMIMKRNPKVVGIYRLTMKKDSDNFRDSAIQGIIQRIDSDKVEIIIYEPNIRLKEYSEFKVVNELNDFKRLADVIVANRLTDEINDVREKVYTRDLFSRD
ncbi:nucleotide sugar dehydrogenase [Paenibacillus sp. MMS20-IR301]|uniref:nucleotide sugar dehydrogenase n=1 Tax=Paenibacillus sp. MMS20-IR301 TaxID=2895946 RepID=UPI0028E5EF07|nr:nucleotide sugar dehydrogenase [Paenibacillus sp. MMS20-IR301]WNS43530.1 nucleotide sugar dehydrogenase [Paenibacillus sp. MMS20-IR301]